MLRAVTDASDQPKPHHTTAILALIGACAFWGVSFPLLKVLHLDQAQRVPEASSIFLSAWIQVARFVVAALLLLPVVFRLARPTRREVVQGLLLALWGGVGMALQADGLAYTEASTCAFLTQAYCVILPLWAALRTRRWPSRRVAGATLFVIIGGGILAGIRPGQLALGRGEAETLLSAVFFTFQILTLENSRFAGNRGIPITFFMCAGIAVLFLPVAWLTAPHPAAVLTVGASLPALLFVASLGIFCTIGAFLLMNTWQKRVTATEAGLIYTSEPVFAASYALFLPALLGTAAGVSYPNESLTPPLVLGGGLILLANIWMQWRRVPHKPAVAPAP